MNKISEQLIQACKNLDD